MAVITNERICALIAFDREALLALMWAAQDREFGDLGGDPDACALIAALRDNRAHERQLKDSEPRPWEEMRAA